MKTFTINFIRTKATSAWGGGGGGWGWGWGEYKFNDLKLSYRDTHITNGDKQSDFACLH